MATKKHKRKTGQQSQNKSAKSRAKHVSVISKHPRTFFYFGALLVAVGGYLLITGSHSNSKIGLAMLSIFIGGSAAILANSALPKKNSIN